VKISIMSSGSTGEQKLVTHDETDFYILLGLQIEDLIDDLKFTTTITYK